MSDEKWPEKLNPQQAEEVRETLGMPTTFTDNMVSQIAKNLMSPDPCPCACD